VLRLARRGRAHLDVELKNLPGEPAFDASPRTADRLADHLLASGIPAHRLTVQSFWAEDLVVLGRRLPGVRRSLLVPAGAADVGIEVALAARTEAVGLAWPAEPEAVRAAQARGLWVMTHTVNDVQGVLAAAAAGVNAIITDDPAMARRALATAPRRSPGSGEPVSGHARPGHGPPAPRRLSGGPR
jgi:glycerophosphoryl diester phosphodiesterase